MIINPPIIDNEITAFPCCFEPKKDVLRVYFYFQSLQDEQVGSNINTEYVFVNAYINTSTQPMLRSEYEPFEVRQDSTNLLNPNRRYIDIPSYLLNVQSDKDVNGFIFPMNSYINIRIMTLGENISTVIPNFFQILQNRIWHRTEDKLFNACVKQFLTKCFNPDTGVHIVPNEKPYCSMWSPAVVFYLVW